MKTVRNKTNKPLRIRLPGGKTLFLGATKRAQLREEALEHPPVKKLLDAGDIEVSDGLGPKHGAGGGDGLAGKGGSQAHAGGRAKAKTGDR